jgi:hypothetical protein
MATAQKKWLSSANFMLFSLPDNTITGIIGYAFDFFDSIKLYILLAMGVGLGLLIVGIIYDLFFSYGAEVKKEAKYRFAERREEEEEHIREWDIQEELEEMEEEM